MLEYTTAFKNAYSWAKSAYDYLLQTSNNPNVTINDATLSAKIAPTIDQSDLTIQGTNDWNFNSRNLVSYLAGMYASIDQLNQYYLQLYGQLDSRLQESETRIKQLTSNLRVINSSFNKIASTSISIDGGDTTSIDNNPNYYINYPAMSAISDEGVYRLKDTGFFSSIRSNGGFAGFVTMDNSLGTIINQGNLPDIADGNDYTYWLGTFYTPGPIRSDNNTIPWLPSDYTYGYACQITYNLDRPTQVTEVYIDPLSTEPFDLVSISWRPSNIQNLVTEPDYPGPNWRYIGSSFLASGGGIGATNCSVAYATSGWATQTFLIPASAVSSSSSGVTTAGNRCEFFYNMKGVGDVQAGGKIIWLDKNGNALDFKQQQDYPTSFYNSYAMIANIPTNAVSGIFQLGIFNYTAGPASAYFDAPTIYIGDELFEANTSIINPTTIPLPKIVFSNRFTFTFCQRNPRREVLIKDSQNTNFTPIVGNKQIDTILQSQTQQVYNQLTGAGPERGTFAYRVGFKELDLRYREHIPRGAIVSYPLFSNQEIRRIWITTEMGVNYNSGVTFDIFPFANDTNQSINLLPYTINTVYGTGNNGALNGETLYIYSSEEFDAGWANVSNPFFVAPIIDQVDNYNGTDQTGKLILNYPVHLRRPTLRNIIDWIDENGIWQITYDPNTRTYFGIPNTTGNLAIKDAIRSGKTAATVNLGQFTNISGYNPLKVTITTDRWTAIPDAYGNPNVSKVRYATNEILNTVANTVTTTTTQTQVQSFNQWLNSTTVGNFKTYMATLPLVGSKVIDIVYQFQNPYNKSLQDLLNSNTSIVNSLTADLQTAYNYLNNQNRLPVVQNTNTTQTSNIPSGTSYSTRFSPIIAGQNGLYLNLYWTNSTTLTATSQFVPLGASEYNVTDPQNGVIKVLTNSPTGFTNIIANYLYLIQNNTEDFFGAALSTYSTPASSISSIIGNSSFTSQSLPITRNMTDYLYGKTPTLKPPNFDQLSSDYYPVIEYYINQNNELIFSRDFFTYGDLPGVLKVEYETLAIQPRVGVQVIREPSPSTTPIIQNITMRVLESSGSMLQEAQ